MSVSVAEAYSIAVSHFQSGQLKDAEDICRQILSMEPKNPDTLHLIGVISTKNGRHKNAVKYITQAIKIKKDNPAYYSNLGVALYEEGKYFEAARNYRQALAIDPDFAEAWMNLGNALTNQDNAAEAIDCYRKAVELSPQNVLAFYNLARALQVEEKHEEAAEQYRKALEINPYFAEAHTNLGVVYQKLGRLTESVAHHEQAINISPGLAEAYNNIGLALNDLGLFDLATQYLQKALGLSPENANTYNSLGETLREQGRLGDAENQYQTALKLDRKNAEAYLNLGIVYRLKRDVGKSIEALEQAVALSPDSANTRAELVHQLQHACAWKNLAKHEEKLLSMLRRKEGAFSPFIALCLPSTAEEQLSCAREYIASTCTMQKEPYAHAPGRQRDRIRVGYLSADLHKHPTAFLMAELFERHDREKFEINAYSYGPDDGSEMRQRLIRAFDNFLDIRPVAHAAAAKRIYDDGIDILVDLKGFTGEARLQILAFRPAPIQVNYLGYPGTMGADFIDYIIADPFITPMEHQPFYSEKIVQLPHCYQPNDTKRETAGRTPTRAECSLPEQGFVFCSFNSTYKITPAFFDVWMRLLAQTPGSVLWLFEANALVKDNLRREAAARGVDPGRLVFAPALPLAEHLARHRLADLFLDTLPVNAHTTTSDALWTGLPVVTCAGPTFAGRVAGSLLTASGLPDLVTHTLADYEALALGLARDPARLAGYRAHLENTRLQNPLFDIQRLTRNLESAYTTMWDKWQAGHAPEAFAVRE